ncbi:MAG: hypothetical protein M3Z23_10625 [Acidobacteriota bacterium]|nr:hypothetical protein [Acidobacteriota bacterium]
MKSFAFPLEKALRWRRSQQNLEQIRAQTIAGKIAELAHRREDLRNERSLAEGHILEAKTVDGAELAALGALHFRAAKQDAVLIGQTATHERELSGQREKLVEAQRKVKLLEILRERRLAQWSALAAREQEQFAGEAFLGRWQAAKAALNRGE